MPSVFVVPGFPGSELRWNNVPFGPKKVWVDYAQLGLGRFKYLKLAADGVSADPTFGLPLTVGAPLAEYYGPCLNALTSQLGPKGWQVLPFGYDFRQDNRLTGLALAFAVQHIASAADPCTLVGHSMGGLVCRAAWYYLGLVGKTNLVRRIVTLGTPHWGSYATWDLMNGQENTEAFIANASSVAWNTLPNSPVFPPFSALDATVQIINSWPSVYQLLPVLSDPNSPFDTSRPKLFDPTQYLASAGINAALMTDAATTWSTFLSNPATQPPASVLTCVQGVDSGSVESQLLPGGRGYMSVWHPGALVDGDGKVARPSAVLATAGEVVSMVCGHQDLPNWCGITGVLSQLIRQVNPVPATPSVPVPLDFVGDPNANKLSIVSQTDVPPDVGFLPIEPVIVPPYCYPILGPPPYPSRATVAVTGHPQVFDHDC